MAVTFEGFKQMVVEDKYNKFKEAVRMCKDGDYPTEDTDDFTRGCFEAVLTHFNKSFTLKELLSLVGYTKSSDKTIVSYGKNYANKIIRSNGF